MKTEKIELDVDFIGSQSSALTKDEGKTISDFVRTRKSKNDGVNYFKSISIQRDEKRN